VIQPDLPITHSSPPFTLAKMAAAFREQVEEYIIGLQDRIVASLEQLDSSAPKFNRDAWTREEGGRGLSCAFAIPNPTRLEETNTILEKAGVNISIVYGSLPPAAVKQMKSEHASLPDSQGALPFDRPRKLPLLRGLRSERSFETHRLVVWRRMRLDPVLSIQGRRDTLPRDSQKCLRQTRPERALSSLQEVVRRVLLYPPSEGDERRRRDFLRRS